MILGFYFKMEDLHRSWKEWIIKEAWSYWQLIKIKQLIYPCIFIRYHCYQIVNHQKKCFQIHRGQVWATWMGRIPESQTMISLPATSLLITSFSWHQFSCKIHLVPRARQVSYSPLYASIWTYFYHYTIFVSSSVPSLLEEQCLPMCFSSI